MVGQAWVRRLGSGGTHRRPRWWARFGSGAKVVGGPGLGQDPQQAKVEAKVVGQGWVRRPRWWGHPQEAPTGGLGQEPRWWARLGSGGLEPRWAQEAWVRRLGSGGTHYYEAVCGLSDMALYKYPGYEIGRNPSVAKDPILYQGEHIRSLEGLVRH